MQHSEQRRRRRSRVPAGCAASVAALVTLVCAGAPPAAAAPGPLAARTPRSASPSTPPAPPDILRAPTRVARTAEGDVGYREVGSGSPVLLVMGYGGSMDYWAPGFVDSLAARHTVVVFDNAGVGGTSPAGSRLTVPAMADQTSALISALRLHRPTVVGWSMGGMIAQALAVRHPGQAGRLVLAATQAGTGRALPIPPAAAAALNSPDPAVVLSVLFPADQRAAARAYASAIAAYPGFYGASSAVKDAQTAAIREWMAGDDAAGHETGRVGLPVLVADGASDELDPAANARILAGGFRRARTVLYPDAGHAFLFQEGARFVALIDRFAR